jgi:hypothetical protein
MMPRVFEDAVAKFGAVGLLGIFLSIIVVKAIAGNRLASAARTWFKVAADLMNSTTFHAAIITLREGEIVFTLAVTNTIIILPTDAELYWFNARTLVPMPPRLFVIPVHVIPPNVP